MASIKINFNRGKDRTSTTFSEFTARFFIQSWHSMQSLKEVNAETWTIVNPDDMFYRDLQEVKTEFQACVNHMIKYYAILDKESGYNTRDTWTRDEIEYYILLNIYQSNHGAKLKYD